MRTRLSFAALAIAGVLWGLGFVFGKIALAGMPVGAMVLWRFATASLVVLPFLFGTKAKPLYQPRTLLLLAIAGVLYVPVQFLVQFKGLSLTSVTHASLVVAVLPGLLAIGSTLLFRHALRRTTIAALALSIVGAIVIVARPDTNASLAGDALVLLSLGAAVAWVLFTQRFLSGLPPVQMTSVMLWLGTLALFFIEISTNAGDVTRVYPNRALLAAAASGVFSTAASTVLWNTALQRVDAARAGVFINLEPVVGAICGVAIFGDPATAALYLGGAMVVGGAMLVQQ